MADRVIALAITVKGTKEETLALQKLQAGFDSVKKEIAKVNVEERKGIITAKQASDARARLNVQLMANRNALLDMQNAVLKNNDALKKNSQFVAGVRAGVQQAIPSFREFAGALGLAFSVGALVNFGKESVLLSAKMESLQNTFNFAFGSVEEGGKAMDFVRDLADELGLELLSTADAFKNFSASSVLAGVSTDDTKKQFRQVSLAVTALGLSADDANGVFLALSQIMSKGTVQAEELRGQIGERIPGAFELAAKAMGVTTQELNGMLKKGEVISKDFLPKFAQQMEDTFGTAIPAAVDSTQAKLNRLSNFFTDLKLATGGFFADALAGFDNLRKGSGGLLDEIGKGDAQKVIEKITEAAQAQGITFAEGLNNTRKQIVASKEALELYIKEQQALIKNGKLATSFTADEIKTLEVSRKTLAQRKEELKIIDDQVKKLSQPKTNPTQIQINNIESLENKLKGLNELLKSEEIGSDAFNSLQKEIKATQKALDDATGKESKKHLLFLKEFERKEAGVSKQVAAANKELAKSKDLLLEIQQVPISNLDSIANDFTDLEVALARLSEFIDTDLYRSIQGIANTSLDLFSSITELSNVQSENRIKDIEDQTDSQLKSIDLQIEAQKKLGNNTESLEKKKQKLQEETAKKIEAEQKRQFERNKKLQIATAAIAGAQAILRAFADYAYPYSLVIAGLTAASTGVQIKAISSQEFAEGGIIPKGGGIIQGRSHAQGGVKFSAGGITHEAQGGEPILVKEAGDDPVTRNILSQINVSKGGRAFAKGGIVPAHKFQSGGMVPSFTTRSASQASQGLSTQQLIGMINEMVDGKIANIKVTNVATETAATNNKVVNIQSDVSFR